MMMTRSGDLTNGPFFRLQNCPNRCQVKTAKNRRQWRVGALVVGDDRLRSQGAISIHIRRMCLQMRTAPRRGVSSPLSRGLCPLVSPSDSTVGAAHRYQSIRCHHSVALGRWVPNHLGWMTSASRKRQDLVLVMSRDGGASESSLPISLVPVSGRRQQGRSQRAQWRALGDASPGH